jgi:kumamolisin
MTESNRVVLSGSDRQAEVRYPRVGEVDLSQQITVTVYLRGQGTTGWIDEQSAKPVRERRYLSRSEWAASHGASDEDVAKVREFAAAAGLTVESVDPARRSVALRGALSAMAAAFDARELAMFGHPSGPYRGREGPLTIPADLDGVITAVLGIDERPQARPHLRRHTTAVSAALTPIQVAEAYGFPTTVNGQGQTIGIIELGGGYNQNDLQTFFSGLGLSTPKVTAVGVDGGSNSPGTDNDSDTEVMLDIEVAGAAANGASIVVYFAGNTDQGFIDAVSTAVHDTTNHLSVVSISWGGPEDSWTAQSRTQMEQVLTEAAGLGVTVTVAAGDNGSTDGQTDGKQHVDFPASAPHALGCGGTSLRLNGQTISSETVWNDGSKGGSTGGGVSIEFPLPTYQANAGVPNNVDTGQPGRGVPDVSGNADPETGYKIFVDGSAQVVGGTSAVAPLWAGLIALVNQSIGAPVGFVNPVIYASGAAAAFRDITVGNNGGYEAGPGWDPCSGCGSPKGSSLAQVL